MTFGGGFPVNLMENEAFSPTGHVTASSLPTILGGSNYNNNNNNYN